VVCEQFDITEEVEQYTIIGMANEQRFQLEQDIYDTFITWKNDPTFRFMLHRQDQ